MVNNEIRTLDSDDLIAEQKIREMLLCPSEIFEEFRNIMRINKKIKNKVFIRASLEISNICRNKCRYCGMSCENKSLIRYKMNKKEICRVIDKIVQSGIKQLHIVSGEAFNNLEDLYECIEYAKKQGLSVTAVLGKRKKEEYEQLKKAGVNRYIMKFETSNNKLYEYVKHGETLDDRLKHILMLKGMGFQVGTGTIIGLPGSNIDDICGDLLLLKKLKPDMASSSRFSPNLQSEFRNFPAGSSDLTLRFISLMRNYLKEGIYIPSSSSLGFEGQIKALKAGANVVSVHFTPEKYAEKFSMYKSENRIKRQIEEIKEIVERAEMEVEEYV